MALKETIIRELKKRAIQFIEAVWYIGVIIVLLVWILPDFLPKRRRK